MPVAPPRKGEFITSVSKMKTSATVAIEKKMPRSRTVSKPTRKPISPVTTLAAAICTSTFAPKLRCIVKAA
ncbi:MAG: hypothetical protein EBW11_02175 [Betaproteobacteria bacterium]|nr:hypothetical protein [Betaproteobacteria bacterium]